MPSIVNSTKYLRKIYQSYNNSSRKEKKMETITNSFYMVSILLILKFKDIMREVNYSPFSLINIDATNTKQDINKPKPTLDIVIHIQILTNLALFKKCKESVTLENQCLAILIGYREKIKSSLKCRKSTYNSTSFIIF